MNARLLLAALTAAQFLAADTLILRDGRKIEGAYLGGTSRQIRMAVGDRIETYDVSDALDLQFGTSTTPPAAAAAAPLTAITPASPGVEVPANSQLVVRMIDAVDSEKDQIGQTYRASLDEPIVVGGKEVLARGADAVVKLVDDKKAGALTGKTEIRLDMVSVTVNGRVVDVATSDVVQAGASRTKNTAAVVGGTSALGAIIGAIAGGGRGAAIGAGAGAGAGTAVQLATKGSKVKVPSESRLSFTLEQPLKF